MQLLTVGQIRMGWKDKSLAILRRSSRYDSEGGAIGDDQGCSVTCADRSFEGTIRCRIERRRQHDTDLNRSDKKND